MVSCAEGKAPTIQTTITPEAKPKCEQRAVSPTRAKQNEPRLPARESHAAARISIGDSVATVLSAMGQPESRRRFSSAPSIEVLHHLRVVVGPPRQRQIITKSGTAVVTDSIRYEDPIEIYCRSGSVVAVTKERSTQLPERFGGPEMQL